MRQARAKQWYEQLHTKFVRVNGNTCPAFKSLLADIARRARHTVNEGGGTANPRWDWTENNPILKGAAGHSTGAAKTAERSVNENDEAIEMRWDWVESNPILKGEAGDGKEAVEEDIDNNEREVKSEDGKATDDEDVTENRLVQDVEDLEDDVIDLLEHVRMLKGGKKEINRHEEKHEEAGTSIRFWIKLTKRGGW